MSDASRQILMPGETAQAAAPAALPAAAEPAPEQRKKPGPKPRAAQAAAPGGDDLDEFDSNELPARPAVPPPPAGLESFSPEQLMLVRKLVAEGVTAAMSSRDPATAIAIAAKNAQAVRLPTQDEARAMCEDMVTRNIRPRAVETVDGWYVHPEMTRVVDHGVARLQVN